MYLATSKSEFIIHDQQKWLCPKFYVLKAANEAECKSGGASLSDYPAE